MARFVATVALLLYVSLPTFLLKLNAALAGRNKFKSTVTESCLDPFFLGITTVEKKTKSVQKIGQKVFQGVGGNSHQNKFKV